MASYDLSTKNTSFLNMHKKLKSLQIKNDSFMLLTINPKLLNFDIDQYKEKLSEISVIDIIEECRNNIWFFFREILRVPYLGSNRYIQFQLNEINMAMIFAYEHNISFLAESPRHTFRTNTLSCLMLYDKFVNGNYFNYIIMGRQMNAIKQQIEYNRLLIKYNYNMNPDIFKSTYELEGKYLGVPYEKFRLVNGLLNAYEGTERYPDAAEIKSLIENTKLYIIDAEYYNHYEALLNIIRRRHFNVYSESTINKRISESLKNKIDEQMPRFTIYNFDKFNLLASEEIYPVKLIRRTPEEMGMTQIEINHISDLLSNDTELIKSEILMER